MSQGTANVGVERGIYHNVSAIWVLQNRSKLRILKIRIIRVIIISYCTHLYNIILITHFFENCMLTYFGQCRHWWRQKVSFSILQKTLRLMHEHSYLNFLLLFFVRWARTRASRQIQQMLPTSDNCVNDLREHDECQLFVIECAFMRIVN